MNIFQQRRDAAEALIEKLDKYDKSKNYTRVNLATSEGPNKPLRRADLQKVFADFPGQRLMITTSRTAEMDGEAERSKGIRRNNRKSTPGRKRFRAGRIRTNEQVAADLMYSRSFPAIK